MWNQKLHRIPIAFSSIRNLQNWRSHAFPSFPLRPSEIFSVWNSAISFRATSRKSCLELTLPKTQQNTAKYSQTKSPYGLSSPTGGCKNFTYLMVCSSTSRFFSKWEQITTKDFFMVLSKNIKCNMEGTGSYKSSSNLFLNQKSTLGSSIPRLIINFIDNLIFEMIKWMIQ